MIISNTKSEIPITQNVVLAMRLDTDAEKEHIIIGELPEVRRYLRGDKEAEILVKAKRSFGSFILDCSQPLANDLADVRAILSDSAGKKKSPFFERSREILNQLWQSDNLAYRYVAVRIWQEYHKACGIKGFDLYSAIEHISLPLMFDLKNDILEWQEAEPQDPLTCLMPEYFVFPAFTLYSGRKLDEYQTADISLLPLVVYYLKTVYNKKTYIQTCKRCGKLFRANTANIPTFCSDECKKEQNRENKRRFDEKAKVTPYEATYKTNYMYWYNRIKKLRQAAAGTERLAKVESAFDAFCKEAVQRKKAVADGEADERDFESWMLRQRDSIDGLMEG